MFNVVIIGGEFTEDYNFFRTKCIYYLKDKAKSGEHITILTTGDDFVEKFATRYGIDTQVFNTNWKQYGKDALFERNKILLDKANAVIYFESNQKDPECIYNYALKLNIPSRKVSKV